MLRPMALNRDRGARPTGNFSACYSPSEGSAGGFPSGYFNHALEPKRLIGQPWPANGSRPGSAINTGKGYQS